MGQNSLQKPKGPTLKSEGKLSLFDMSLYYNDSFGKLSPSLFFLKNSNPIPLIVKPLFKATSAFFSDYDAFFELWFGASMFSLLINFIKYRIKRQSIQHNMLFLQE